MVSTKNRRKESYNTNDSEGNKEVKISHYKIFWGRKGMITICPLLEIETGFPNCSNHTHIIFCFVEKLSDIKIGSASI
jgi:hypothetical protein